MSEQRAVRPQPAPRPVARQRAGALSLAPSGGPRQLPDAPMVEHDRWMELQRGIGNQALSRLLQRRTEVNRGADAQTGSTGPATLQSVQHVPLLEWSRKTNVGLQAKLRISEPGDIYEQEADRVAEHVMRMPAPGLSGASTSVQLHRKCAACAEEDRLQNEPHGISGPAVEAPAIVHETLRSPGRPLDAATRAYFEPRFGRDFGAVRVHTGPAAEQSTRNVNAHAYTVGHDIVFDAGRYAPGTQEGRKLLAHELTHVVQQSTPVASSIAHRLSGDLRQEAHGNSRERASSRQRIAATPANSGRLQRQRAHFKGGVREAVLEVRWKEDSDKFYFRVMDAILASSAFRGASPSDFTLFSNSERPLQQMTADLHDRYETTHKEGQRIKLKFSASYDADREQFIGKTLSVVEPAAETSSKKATPAETVRPTEKKEGPPKQEERPEPVDQAMGAITLSGATKYCCGGNITIVTWYDRPTSGVPEPGEVLGAIWGDVLTRHSDGIPEDDSRAMLFERWRGKWFTHWAWHWPWRRRSSEPPPRKLSASEEFERETGMKDPRKINKILVNIAIRSLHEADPTSLKNLPFTIGSIVVPWAGMKMIYSYDSLGELVTIERVAATEDELAGAANEIRVTTTAGKELRVEVAAEEMTSVETGAAVPKPAGVEPPAAPARTPESPPRWQHQQLQQQQTKRPVAPAAEGAGSLEKLGLSEQELTEIKEGGVGWGNLQRGETQATIIFRLDQDKFTAGILNIKTPAGADPWDSVKAFLSFKNDSMNLARQLGAKTLRLEGNAVGNQGVRDLLLKFRFVEFSPDNFFLEIPVP